MGVGFASRGTTGERDGVAEGSEPAGVVAGEAGGAHLVEVVAAQLGVRLAIAHDVVGDDEDAVRDGDDGSLVAAALDQAPVLGGEIAVAFAHRGAGTFDERRAERAIRVAGATAQALPRALV